VQQAGAEGIIGAIAGRALYEGKLELQSAQAAPTGIGQSLMGLAKRVIPAWTSRRPGGEGVNFVGLPRRATPLKSPRATTARPDELCFLDITASSDERDILLHVIVAVARASSFRSRWAAACARWRMFAGCSMPAPTRYRSTCRGAESEPVREASHRRQPMHRGGDRRQA